MSKDLQIIEELESRFRELCIRYKLNDNNEVVGLDLITKSITNKGLKLIGELTSLEVLWLGNNQITKIEGLEKLANLQDLDLCNNRITTIQGLDNINKLEVLDLRNNQIDTIQGLDKLTKLKRLYLCNNNIPKSQIKEFQAKYPKIKIYD